MYAEGVLQSRLKHKDTFDDNFNSFDPSHSSNPAGAAEQTDDHRAGRICWPDELCNGDHGRAAGLARFGIHWRDIGAGRVHRRRLALGAIAGRARERAAAHRRCPDLRVHAGSPNHRANVCVSGAVSAGAHRRRGSGRRRDRAELSRHSAERPTLDLWCGGSAGRNTRDDDPPNDTTATWGKPG